MGQNILRSSLFLCLFCLSWMMHDSQRTAKDPVIRKYARFILREVQSNKIHFSHFRKSDPSLCPSYKGYDKSTCFHQWVRKVQIRSSVSMIQMMEIAIHIAAEDRKKGYDEETVSLMMADSILGILEKTDLSQFELVVEKTYFLHALGQQMKNDDEVLVQSAVQKILPFIQKKINPSQFRKLASVSKWQDWKRKSLQSRYSEVLKKKWTYPKPTDLQIEFSSNMSHSF